ncbi:ribonuclease III [soil metagenome]
MSLPTFKNQDLLTNALTHRSALNEHLSTSPESNERLEFLGDAVLELAATKFLFAAMPEEQEGMLTAYRSALVKTTTLAEVATELGLGERLFMSKGEEASGGRQNIGLLANTVEAVLGALYLDQGFEAAYTLIETHIFPRLDEIKEKKLYKDSKSQLQELVQSKGMPAPEYVVIDESGPDHDRSFTIKVLVDGLEAGRGKGKSKQLAQQSAAQYVLEHAEDLKI